MQSIRAIIKSNVTRKETSIKNPQTGSYLEIDVWIPELQLGFEFQSFRNSKLESVKSRGDTLIIVPCWWIGDENSLKSSVTFQRPDLFSTFQHAPISLNPPRNHFRSGSIPDIGEMMLASFPSAFQLDESRFASYYTWWMGEKYDGVRCCWHPLDQQFRNGLKLPLPSPIMSLFPNAFLDSEIWFGRGFFIESQKTLHALSTQIDWPCFRVLTFDLPDPDFFDIPFEKRYEALMNSLDYKHSFLYSNILGQRLRAKSKLHVTGFMKHIIENEGEGVILRKPGSLYESGRTESLLKLKAVRGDREALVVNVEADSSLLLQLPTGETFNIAKKNVQSDIHPHRGDIVSFTFENYSRTSAPTNPKVVRIRKDISWKEVLNNAAASAPKSLLLGDKSKKAMGEKIKPIGYWKADKKKNMRIFFENIAKERGVDPLVPDSWYSVNQALIKSFKGGPAILWHYKGSYTKALVDLFPEMKLDVQKFANMPMNFWKDLRNRRQFFVNMASKLGFDPLVPENWYSVDEATILSHKGAASLEFYYPKGFSRALVHLFPEIGLDAAKFISLPYNHWHEPQNRRTYLDYFAESKGYDPLSPESWYLMLKDRLLTTKNLSSLLSFYKGNISSALLHLYPNIGLDPISLNSVARDFWKDVANRRDFFLRIAQAQSFDPMEPDNWYQVKPETIASTMGATSVLAFYNNSYVEALRHLFPGMKFDETKFITSPRNHFAEVAHRRKFEQFARAKGFDPLFVSNWYHMPKEAVMSMKGATSMLFLYGNSYSRAIMHLFPELKWDPAKFSRRKNHWQLEANRKDFFVDFAKDKGIDLMSAEEWYKVRSGEILAGAEAVLQHYDGNFGKALAVLFPNIGVDLKRFESPPKKRWKDPTLRRKFFLDFARAQSFDYRDPNNWYPLTHEAILSQKGAHSVLWYYGGSFAKALIELFPEMPLDFHKFTHPPYSFWKDERHRIEYFTRFADEEGFNPLVADNWYQTVDKLLARKGVNSILHHHEGSVSVALTQLFPNVTFDSTKLKPKIDSYWIVKQNRRKFFKDFALKNSFDPLVAANWSQVDENKLKSAKGAAAVLSYYGSVPKALNMLFPEVDWNGVLPRL